MQIVDGRALADGVMAEIKRELQAKRLKLGVISVGEDAVARKFIDIKNKRAAELGVVVREYKFQPSISTKKLRREIGALVHSAGCDGFIVQLPLPPSLNAQYILNGIPPRLDVDCLNQNSVGAFLAGRSKIAPPAVAAVRHILASLNFDLLGKKIVIIGAGKLIGRPLSLWLLQNDLPFSVITRHSPDYSAMVREADVVVSGIGKPRAVSGDWIRGGALVIDAGAGISGGRVTGDVDADSLKEKDGFLVPVPGGVGPLTVAYLFKNLATLAA